MGGAVNGVLHDRDNRADWAKLGGYPTSKNTRIFEVGINFLIQINLFLAQMVRLGALFHFHVFLAHSEQ